MALNDSLINAAEKKSGKKCLDLILYIHTFCIFFCSFYNYVCGTPEIILSVKQNVLFLFVKKF